MTATIRLFVCLSAVGLWRGESESAHADERPNILILMTDQQRFDALGCYGCDAIETPNLDRLAREGALFERCYSPCPICTPSRASMLTGKSVPGHGVYKLHDILAEDELLLPHRLQALGYETSLVGKLHVSGLWREAEHRHPNDGFEHYHWCIDPGLNFDSPFNTYARWVERKDPRFYQRLKKEGKRLRHFPAGVHFSTWAAEATVDLIESRDVSRPFFVFMSLFDPHDPYYDHPQEAAGQVDAAAVGRPQPRPNDPAMPDGVRREWAKSQAVLQNTKEYKDNAHSLRKGYYASIAFLDEQIGRVLRCLDSQGLAGSTLVIFLSDHGDMLFDRGLFTKGAYFYDPSVRVPLLIRLPGHMPAGMRVDNAVQHMDVTATVLAAAGYSRDQLDAIYPHSMDLIALAVEGSAYARRRDWAVCMFRNSGYGPGGSYFDPPIHATMFFDGRHKLNVFHKLPGDASRLQGELYDIESDPQETSNLWNRPDHVEIKSRLMGRMLNWMMENELRACGSRGGERFRQSVMREYGSE